MLIVLIHDCVHLVKEQLHHMRLQGLHLQKEMNKTILPSRSGANVRNIVTIVPAAFKGSFLFYCTFSHWLFNILLGDHYKEINTYAV